MIDENDFKVLLSAVNDLLKAEIKLRTLGRVEMADVTASMREKLDEQIHSELPAL